MMVFWRPAAGLSVYVPVGFNLYWCRDIVVLTCQDFGGSRLTISPFVRPTTHEFIDTLDVSFELGPDMDRQVSPTVPFDCTNWRH